MKKNGILFRVASGLLAAALTLSLTACGGSSSNSDASAAADSGATHLRLIYSPSLCAAPMYIAIENGYFEDEGLDIEQVTVDAAHVSEAIGADQVDVGMGLIGKMLQPLENGLPIKFTTGIHTGCTKLLVPGDSDIKSVADLKGKKIGVPGLADAATVVSKRSLSAAGIGVTDQNMEVEFSVYSRNDLAQALQNGAVDAIALGDPAASIAEEQYGLTALIDTATDPEYKDEYCCAAFVTSKLAEENPKAAAAFTRAVQKASQWVQEHPDETAKIITEKEYVSGDVDFCAQILKTYNYKPSVQGGYDALKQNAEELTQIGVLKEGTDATRLACSRKAPMRPSSQTTPISSSMMFRMHRRATLPPIPPLNPQRPPLSASSRQQQPRLRTTAAAAKSPSPHRTQTQRHNIVFTGRKGLCRN